MRMHTNCAGLVGYQEYKKARAAHLVKQKGLNNNRTHDRQPWTLADLLMNLGEGPPESLNRTRAGPAQQDRYWLRIAQTMLASCKSHTKFAAALEQAYHNNGLKVLLADLAGTSTGTFQHWLSTVSRWSAL
jgi:hypothetical protein